MTFLEIAKKRCSVRKYQDRQVEDEKLQKILTAANVAPTAANLQPIRLIVVQGQEGLAKINKAANVFKTTLAIIVCADHSKAWKRPFDGKSTADTDAAILTTHMMMEATELGLGSVWVCYFKPDIIKQEFNLPDTMEPVNILVLGYPAEPLANPNRHNDARITLKELVYYEKF